MLFSRVETLVIALALIVPEGLRGHARALEPYPAVILPAGAGTVRVKAGNVTIKRTYLSARRKGKWQEVDARQFMAPIPRHYLNGVAARGFGLATPAKASARQRENAAETKRWMQAKLAEQNFATRKVRVVTEKTTIAFPSGETVRKKLHRKKTYDLD